MESTNKYNLGWIYKKTSGNRILLLAFTLLILLNNIVNLSIAYYLKLFVDIATGHNQHSLIFIGSLSLATVCMGGIISMYISILSRSITRRIEHNLSAEIMNTIMSRKLIDISKQHIGELMTKLTIDIQAVSRSSVDIIKNIIGSIFLMVIATIGVFYLNWKMALILIFLTPFIWMMMSLFNPRIKTASKEDKVNEERVRSVLQENLSKLILIKTYFMDEIVITKIKNAYLNKIHSGEKLGKWEGLINFSGVLLTNAIFLVALGAGSYLVIQGETTVGSLIAIIQLLNYIFDPISAIVNSISTINQSLVSGERLGEIYNLKEENKMVYEKSPYVVDAIKLLAEDISFDYFEEANRTYVLKNINASFENGKITGIIGASGSGKSTLLKILIGLYTPNKGNIKLSLTKGDFYNHEILPLIAYVPPEGYLFTGTLAENIIMSDKFPDKIRMENAAKDAGMLEFINSLKDGFETYVGEKGKELSSGQAQRIAIARAIYKKSPVFVFDEPTANLDLDSIKKFHNAIKKIAKDKICIIVSHDEATISICDTIYSLKEGSLDRE